MTVYVANFGRGNYAWERCLAAPSVATMNSVDTQPFWLADDRQGFVEQAVATYPTARGNVLPRATASRWFNLMGIVAGSHGDLWLHKAGDEVWWTRTTDAPVTIDEAPTPSPHDERGMFEAHKPAEPWRNRDEAGTPLSWASIHPKARHFLITESTLQALSPDYAAYAEALVEGRDLSPWHGSPRWGAVEARARTKPIRHVPPIEYAALDLAQRAFDTARRADGREVTKRSKVKAFGFADVMDARAYILELLRAQEGICNLTGLPLQYPGEEDDPALRCSLDRIDSGGDYAPGNLQVVCRFANRWKSDGTDEEFKRLIAIVRGEPAGDREAAGGT